MDACDVTVVVPTHGRPGLLAEALASIEAQSLPPAAVVVSDDLADPATREVVERWAARVGFPVRYLDSSGPDAGTAGASRNAGAALATTSLLAFLDDDDLWRPHMLARTVARMEETSADLVVAWTAPSRPDYRMARMREGLTAADAVGRNPGLVGSNFLVRTAFFRRIGGFDPTLPVANDKDLLVRALQAHGCYAVVPEELVDYRVHELAQLTDASPRRAEGIRRYMRKHAALLGPRERRYLRAQLASVLRRCAPSPAARLRHTLELVALRLLLLRESGAR